MREYLNKLTGFGREYWKFWIASAVSIFIGAIGVGIGSIMYSIVDKYHIYAKREEN